MADALSQYFSENNFGEDGGYNERWIKVKVWRIPIWLPNTAGRREAVKFHDLHHIVTEYPTTWRGEAEISAWEVGSGGLRRFYAGWLLDLMNIAQGVVINPHGVYRGFMRGRQASNLYDEKFDESLLNQSVGDIRQRLGLDIGQSPPNVKDHIVFMVWTVTSVLIYITVLFLAMLPLLLIVLWILWR